MRNYRNHSNLSQSDAAMLINVQLYKSCDRSKTNTSGYTRGHLIAKLGKILSNLSVIASNINKRVVSLVSKMAPLYQITLVKLYSLTVSATSGIFSYDRNIWLCAQLLKGSFKRFESSRYPFKCELCTIEETGIRNIFGLGCRSLRDYFVSVVEFILGLGICAIDLVCERGFRVSAIGYRQIDSSHMALCHM